MSPALIGYRLFTFLLQPFLGLILRRRIASGKEDAARIDERFGRSKIARPHGTLVWLHGASVGESKVLSQVIEDVYRHRPDVSFLMTTQTGTSARLMAQKPPVRTIHQMAPIDTVANVRRFLDHWQPDAAVFAEGEIWPNMIVELDRRTIPSVLANARMTEKSLRGWGRVSNLSQRLFGSFHTIIASNAATGDALAALAKKLVESPGNLKHAAPPPSADDDELEQFRARIGDRPVFAALSTHEGEEEVAIEAWRQLSERMETPLFFILAPRHPERGRDIAGLLQGSGVARRSAGDPVLPGTDILLADTMGEMGLWLRLADVVLLGGSLVPGIGGHNPIEPLKLQKPILSGWHVFNFQDDFDQLVSAQAVRLVESAEDISDAATGFLSGTSSYLPDAETIAPLLKGGERALELTVDAVLRGLNGGGHA